MMSAEASVAEEEIIRRKLLIEGDGGSDDRRIAGVLKNFLKWASDESISPEESEQQYQKLLLDLSKCEYSFEKGKMVHEMNLREQRHYERLDHDIEAQIKLAHTVVQQSKEDLIEAKAVRRNRQEYDAIAKIIKSYPNRTDTAEGIETIRQELLSLDKTEKELNDKLDIRRKQFRVLLTAAHNLQALLEEDRESEISGSATTTTSPPRKLSGDVVSVVTSKHELDPKDDNTKSS